MRKRMAAAALAVAASGTIAMAGTASAQQSGLVNVNVGDVTVLQDVDVGVAANVAAEICGVQVPVAVLAEQVVTNDQPFTVCTTGDQNAPVRILPG